MNVKEKTEKEFAEEVKISDNSLTVLEKRYLKQNAKNNKLETPKDMFIRVAKNIAKGDLNFNKDADIGKVANSFYKEMVNFKFLPNSPTLMNAGGDIQQLSACFVLPVEDSVENIFEAIKNTALIHKSGGGTGFSFSRLRPNNDKVMSTKGISSGPLSFLTVFDSATEAIKQGGTRRGANMGILKVDHPDILEFIYAKKDKSKLTNFNLSVGLTKEFIEKVHSNEMYDLVNPRTKKVVSQLNAKKIFDEIVSLAWEGGEPGIVFLDRINDVNPTPHIGELESTNPCGEQPLLPYESCNLGSLNISKFIKNKDIDWVELEKTINTSVHFLDNVIEMNKYPLKQIEKITKANRKIGLGVMGWADTLSILEIPYASTKALDLAEKLMSFIDKKSKEASGELAKVRGNFANFKGSIFDGKYEYMRNSTTTTIAPTGTISIIANASSGVEPYFAIAYYRNVMDKNILPEINDYFVKIAKKNGFYSDKLLADIAEKGYLKDVKDVPEKYKDMFQTSHEIKPEWHIKMQAAFQKYTDNAVSKTINFSNNATKEDIYESYMLAYDLGCKGTTIYRDGSRDEQVLNLGSQSNEKNASNGSLPPVEENVVLQKRPKSLQGVTTVLTTGCGKIYITVNYDEKNKPFEVFCRMGKAGGCSSSYTEVIGRIISLSLQAGLDIPTIVYQLKGISCHKTYGFGQNKVLSCGDAVAKGLEQILKDQEQTTFVGFKVKTTDTIDKLLVEDNESNPSYGRGGACPECGAPVTHVEGCDVCHSCGYSHCS